MPEQTPQTPPYDLLPEVLKETFSFHFSFLTQPPDYRLDKRLVGPSPFMFYDRHVNESRRLRYVASLPSLVDDIIKKVDDRLEELERTREGQLPMWYGTRAGFGVLTKGCKRDINGGPETEIKPTLLRGRMRMRLSTPCLPLVSRWIIHPRAQKYYSALSFYSRIDSEIPPSTLNSPCEDFGLRFAPPDGVHPEVLNSVDDTVKGALADWHNRDLATWIFLPLSLDSEQLLRNLDQLANDSGVLPAPHCTTRGFPACIDDLPVSDDAKVTPWTLPMVNREDVKSTASSDSGEPSTSGVIHPRSLSRPSQSKFQEMKDSTPEGLAHHVWRLAVQKDTTVIVINCGNYERIGIRHRASQTLYLSDMIDLTKPGYGKLHLGTLMSVVDDALIRYQASCEQDRTTRTKKRRHLPKNNEVRRSKRQKLNVLLERSRDLSQLSPRDLKVLWNEILKRPLLLLRFSGGGLHSSVPACCLRAGGALSPYVQDTTDYTSTTLCESYQASECFHLTLDWENSNGITGQVFTGKLQLTLPNGRKLLRNVVAKIAYYEEAQDLVRHEYQVYRRLWSHGVRRIPEIYGLFEDVDNLATLLVMERAAYTFRQREPMTKENKGLLQEVQLSERSACMSIVKEIHDAGVVHRDIRAENLVVAQDGRPMVIDFDNALQDAPDHCKALEIESVEDLLSGKIFFRF